MNFPASLLCVHLNSLYGKVFISFQKMKSLKIINRNINKNIWIKIYKKYININKLKIKLEEWVS